MDIQLKSHELELRGRWSVANGKLVTDTVCERIENLIAFHLVELGRDPTGWETIFVDPSDGRFWERTFPQGDMHGGGPPNLTNLTEMEAVQKYGREILNKK